MKMSNEKRNIILDNDREWRSYMIDRMDKTDENQVNFEKKMLVITTTLKVKLAMSGAFFGFIGGGLISLIVAIVQSNK